MAKIQLMILIVVFITMLKSFEHLYDKCSWYIIQWKLINFGFSILF